MRCAVSPRLVLDASSHHGKWIEALRQESIEFVAVPETGSRTARLLDFRKIEGVILADGPDSRAAGIEDGRDLAFHRTERELVRFARARRIPVVGIGHWAEFLGLYFGGRLCPHPEQRPENRPMDLRVAPGFGPSRAQVHPAGRRHCDPKDFPGVLAPIAWDEHDNIAGFVHRDEPILGIHWQPDGATDLLTEFLKGRPPQPAGGPELDLRTG